MKVFRRLPLSLSLRTNKSDLQSFRPPYKVSFFLPDLFLKPHTSVVEPTSALCVHPPALFPPPMTFHVSIPSPPSVPAGEALGLTRGQSFVRSRAPFPPTPILLQNYLAPFFSKTVDIVPMTLASVIRGQSQPIFFPRRCPTFMPFPILSSPKGSLPPPSP